MSAPREVLVVGASLAGLRAVQALRRRGFDGAITVVGAEAHPPYDRPPLSKQVLRGEWGPERTGLAKAEALEALAADWRLGVRARALDPQKRQVELEDGDRLHYDALVIASGATPRRLRAAPAFEGIHVLRSVEDALAIRRSLAAGARVGIVGAGFIGAEVAASARACGCEVTLLEALPAPLARALPPAVGEAIAALHREEGVAVRCGVGVAGFEGARRVEAVRLADGSRVVADLVVVGVGVEPATGWLQGSGIELENGVLCDERCATSLPQVVAAGDCARFFNPRYGEHMRIEHWTHATEMADAAVARLLDGQNAPPFEPVPFFWSDQYDVKIQLAGRVRPGDEAHSVLEEPGERRKLVLFGRAGRLCGVLGWNRPRQVMRWKRAIAEGCGFQTALDEAEAG